MSYQQQVLDLNINFSDYSFADYVPTNNELAFNSLEQLARGQGEQYLYLWAGGALGKTHLLQATCRYANNSGLAAAYLPLRDSQVISPKILHGLERLAIVCLDDIDAIIGNAAWQAAIFYLFNELRSYGHRLLVSARQPPNQLQLLLPDLASRLTWGLVYQLHDLDDDSKLQLLQKRAINKGLVLNKNVATFLLHHYERSLAKLLEALELLDKASLANKRRLTVPFVKQILVI